MEIGGGCSVRLLNFLYVIAAQRAASTLRGSPEHPGYVAIRAHGTKITVNLVPQHESIAIPRFSPARVNAPIMNVAIRAHGTKNAIDLVPEPKNSAASTFQHGAGERRS